MGRYSSCTYFDKFYDAVEKCFSAVSRADACTILRETILAPDDYELDFNDVTYTKPQIFDMLAHSLAKSCIFDNKEQWHSEFTENAANVIRHMNDGYISQENFDERTEFLNKAAKSEFMLFAALACTKAAQSNDMEFSEELILNIVRFREFGDLIEKYTSNEVNIETSVENFERAKPIYKMLKSLQNLGYYYNFSTKERAGLGINHEDDGDLRGNFNFYNWLKRLMLLQLRKEISVSESVSSQNKEELVKSPLSRISELRGIYNKRRFDSNRFNMLKQSQGSDNIGTKTDN